MPQIIEATLAIELVKDPPVSGASVCATTTSPPEVTFTDGAADVARGTTPTVTGSWGPLGRD